MFLIEVLRRDPLLKSLYYEDLVAFDLVARDRIIACLKQDKSVVRILSLCYTPSHR